MRTIFGRLTPWLLAGTAIAACATSVARAETTDTIQRVADIYVERDRSISLDPQGMVLFNGMVYFSAYDPLGGYELWRSDGTGREQVADINPNGDGSPRQLTVLGGHLYFIADDGEHGAELWRSDGVETELVADIYDGAHGSSPDSLTVVGDQLFFVAGDENSGVQLYVLEDGVALPTPAIVSGANPSAGYETMPINLFAYQGQLVFSGNDGTGYELWRADGASASRVADINPGGGSEPDWFTELGGELYFNADDGSGPELWRWDGATAPALAVDLWAGGGSEPKQLTAVASQLYFEAYDSTAARRVLWRWDGSSASIVADPGAGESVELLGFTAVGNELYFTVANTTSGEMSLWYSDGTTTTAIGAIGSPAEPPDLFAFDGTLYLAAAADAIGVELGEVDLASHTLSYRELNPGSGSATPAGFITYGSGFLFAATADGAGRELWQGGASFAQIEDMDGPGSADPAELIEVGGVLYFSAEDGTHGRELWRSDGTAEGTTLALDVWEGGSSSPRLLTNVNGELAFVADVGEGNPELWQSKEGVFGEIIDITNDGSIVPVQLASIDGRIFYPETDLRFVTASSTTTTTSSDKETVTNEYDGSTQVTETEVVTETLTELDSDPITGVVTQTLTKHITTTTKVTIYDVDGTVLSEDTNVDETITTSSQELDTNAGLELWRTYGKVDNTYMLQEINYSGDAAPHDLMSVLKLKDTDNGIARSEYVYFIADDGLSGNELWYTNGRKITSMVSDINPNGGSNPSGMTVVDNLYIYFSALDDRHGYELWRAELGTTRAELVKDIRLNESDSRPSQLTDVAGTLFFVANNGFEGAELWKSDGSEEGTVMVKDIHPGSAGTNMANLTAVGDKLYFAADDGESGMELWVSDGTEAGTFMLKDINPAGDSSPADFTALGDDFFFTAYTPEAGRELWRSDGTAEGTVLALDINTRGSSNPQELTLFNGDLYFVATDADYGRELWVVDRNETTAPLPPAAGGGGAVNLLFLLLVAGGWRVLRTRQWLEHS